MAKRGDIIICSKCGRETKLREKGMCTKCHSSELRLKHKGICVKCGKERIINTLKIGKCEGCVANEYYHAHKERMAELGKASRVKHTDKRKAYEKERYTRRKASGYEKQNQRKYYLRHPDRIRARAKSLAQRHPERAAHYTQRRNARIKLLPNDLTDEQWQAILIAHNHACAYCGKTGIKLHREHKIPVTRGGGYTAENIVPACQSCNFRKHTMTDVEFREQLKREGM